MKSWSFFLLFLLLPVLVGSYPVYAKARALPAAGVVDRVFDGDTFSLQTGQHVRLLGIQAPEIAHGDVPAQPCANDAHAQLRRLLPAGTHVRLRYDQNPKDRYGRLLAMVETATGIHIQQKMLQSGLSYVYSFPDNRTLIPSLYPAERSARHAKQGCWAKLWRVLPAETPEVIDTHTFGWIEGNVHSIQQVKGQGYINFGSDWHTDTTFFIARPYRSHFQAYLPQWKGKRLRARGAIGQRNGPYLRLTHPEQVEIVK